MNDKPRMMIRLIIKEYDQELKIKILNEIRKKTERVSGKLKFAWYSDQAYLKYPKSTEGIIALYSRSDISLRAVTSLLGCSFQYFSGSVHDASDSTNTVQYEEAIWDGVANQSMEICINKNIIWIHVYLW